MPGNGTEVYVFAGSNTMEVVQRFNLFSGGGVLPPKWGLGFTQRVPTLSTADDVRKEVDAFAKNKFPLDFIGLEPGWQRRRMVNFTAFTAGGGEEEIDLVDDGWTDIYGTVMLEPASGARTAAETLHAREIA